MAPVLLLLHLFIALALVGVVLLQKSEGGALGIGGGGGGGFLTGRGTANLLTRATAGLAAAFFITSTALTILANRQITPTSAFGTSAPVSAPADGSQPAGAPAVPGSAPSQGRGGILDKLQPAAPNQVPLNR